MTPAAILVYDTGMCLQENVLDRLAVALSERIAHLHVRFVEYCIVDIFVGFNFCRWMIFTISRAYFCRCTHSYACPLCTVTVQLSLFHTFNFMARQSSAKTAKLDFSRYTVSSKPILWSTASDFDFESPKGQEERK